MIEIKNVNKYYGKKKVLKSVNASIDLHDHAIYGLVGPNGAGKTTLLKILSGILGYSEGEVLIAGDGADGYDKWSRKNVAFILAGERGLRAKNTVSDNVIYYGTLKGSSLTEVKDNMKRYAVVMEMETLLDRRIEQLSTGEKKKASILCGICSGMKLLILDEPSLGLDIEASYQLKNTLTEIAKVLNISIIISSHDMDFLSALVHRYIFMLEGRIVHTSDDRLESKDIIEQYLSIKQQAMEDLNETVL